MCYFFNIFVLTDMGNVQGGEGNCPREELPGEQTKCPGALMALALTLQLT